MGDGARTPGKSMQKWRNLIGQGDDDKLQVHCEAFVAVEISFLSNPGYLGFCANLYQVVCYMRVYMKVLKSSCRVHCCVICTFALMFVVCFRPVGGWHR